MNYRAVLQYLKEKENGLHEEKNWGASQFLTADNDNPGRFEKLTVVTDDGEILEDELWCPTARSTGTRQPTPRTKAHSRGYIPDPRTNRSIGFSSTHELNCALMLMANRFVVDVEDQPPPVPYKDDEGKWHDHTFDFRATFQSGTRIAFAVKPYRDFEKSGIRDVIRRVRPNLGDFAAQAIIITERQLTRARAWNAKSILRARKCRNEIRCDEVRAVATKINGFVSAFDLASQFSDFGDAMNAVWCLLYDGFLVQARPHRTLFDDPFVFVKR